MYKNAILILVVVFVCYVLANPQIPDQAKVIAGAERAVEKHAKLSPSNAPGCAVGVSLNGQSVYEKGFGMADLEWDIPITPKTILESGSVAKQFTAAAVIQLSLDGKLSLDDPVRKYIPELPDYGVPLTIRHLLNHTSGLRDWGSVMELTGVGRGSRVISQALALDVIYRQKSLNFVPGAEYSYSNSNYNLLAEIVTRVSKQSFPEFMQERFFKPLGMTSSSWRDDYQRVVPGRAQAYEGPLSGPWRLNMPFMNVYGNGGMLTTVGDWLKWNSMLDSKSLGAPLVDAMETVGVLNDGRKISYAGGLFVDKVNGYRQVSHNGSTAGYQTILTRYPDLKLSIAIMCNSTSRTLPLEPDIFKEIMGPFPGPAAPPAAFPMSEEQLRSYVGGWRDERTHNPSRTVFENGALRLGNTPMRPIAEDKFQIGLTKINFIRDKKTGAFVTMELDRGDEVQRLFAEKEWTPTAAELAPLAGEWYSDEADARFTLVAEGDKTFFVQRPSTRYELRPTYRDGFAVPAGAILWFTRDKSGKVEKLHVGVGSRLRDITFTRVSK